MIGWLLSFIPSWVWLFTGIAATAAVWFYLGTRAALVVAVVAGLFAAYQTGVRAERQRGDAASLRATVKELQDQKATALDIQTRMAQTMSIVREENRSLEKSTDALIESFRTRPSAGACTISNADRVRLRSIRIQSSANPGR